MYQETCVFPVLDERQYVNWDGHELIVANTQVCLSNWGCLVLTVAIEGINDYYLDYPLYPLEGFPAILANFNEERLYFKLKEFIPIPPDNIYRTYGYYVFRAIAQPIIPQEKQSFGAMWEAFVPDVAFGLANSRGVTVLSEGLPFPEDNAAFIFDSRYWILRSMIEHDGHITLYEYAQQSTPLIQLSDKGILLQTRAENLSENDFKDACAKICAVLEFAYGTALIPYVYSIRYPDGRRYPISYSNQRIYPIGTSGPLRTGHHFTQLPLFFQTAYPIYFHNSKWWSITRHWYVHMLCTHEVDAGNFYACLLFDRIFDYVSKQDSQHEEWLKAHSNLTDKKKGKKATYLGKLMYLSETFTEDFNCARFKECRNALVHEGEPDTDFPNNVNNHRETINFITKIVLNLLGYRGEFQRRNPITHT